MRSSTLRFTLVGSAVVLLAAACGSGDDEPIVPSLPPVPSSSIPSSPSPSSPSPSSTSPSSTESPAAPTSAVAATPATPVAAVPCVDPSSSKVDAAVDALGTDSQGGAFIIDEHTPGTSANGCPTLEWARATGVGIGNGTVQSHIMFFTNDGRYLGTATSEAYSYTSVVSSSDTSVQVQYRWLNDDDALCCPSNESVVSFDYNGSMVTATGQFPPRP